MSGVVVEDLAVHYGQRVALAGLSTAVASGEWLGVIGPNGAGKTTLLRALAGTVDYEGSVVVADTEVDALSPRELASRVAVVPQHPVLPDDMSVLDYALLGRVPHMGYFGVESRQDVDATMEALNRLDAGALVERRLGTLSGGERQRVVLARALAQGSGVLLLDEPTTALDIGHAQQVLDLVDELRRERGIAVVSSMHDLTAAARYAGRLLLLSEGRGVAEGSPAEVLTAEAISRFSGARVDVVTGPDGAPVVIPRREIPNP